LRGKWNNRIKVAISEMRLDSFKIVLILREVMLRKVMLRVGPFDDLQWWFKIEIS